MERLRDRYLVAAVISALLGLAVPFAATFDVFG
jgi:hypothetical protein